MNLSFHPRFILTSELGAQKAASARREHFGLHLERLTKQSFHEREHMKKICTGIILSCLCVAFVAQAQRAPVNAPGPKTDKVAAFMQMKMEPAKKLLEGLALEDYDMILANSQKISLLTLDEGWMVIQSEAYRRHSKDLQRSLNTIMDSAKQKNLDGALLGYLQMSMKCVDCHKQLRRLDK